jgi:hypothetical protein
MLRERLLHPRWLVYLVVVWGVGLAVLPHPVAAAPLPPSPTADGGGDLDAVRVLLEARLIRDRLAALGVSPADAATALERLTPAERSELAARIQELGAGGDAASFLAFAIIVALVVILILELLGRRVISRP